MNNKIAQKRTKNSGVKLDNEYAQGQFRCGLCDKIFSQKGNMMRHYNALHTENEYNEKMKKLTDLIFESDASKNQDIDVNQAQLQINTELVQQEISRLKNLPRPNKETFDCKECSKKFKYNHDLKIHVKIHDDESLWDYECQKCHKKFYRRQTFEKHAQKCTLSFKDLVHGEKDENELTEEQKKERERHTRMLEKVEDKDIEKEAKTLAKEKQEQDNSQIKEETKEDQKQKEIQNKVSNPNQTIEHKIECEHRAGCNKSFDTLKQYFKHHNYHFAFCREDKKRLKNEIRLYKDLLKKKNKQLKTLNEEKSEIERQLKRYKSAAEIPHMD
ncbi:unnamed protein product [Moneuplotes crassus]|uniref:C2H2-type domain-containing protein n=1 Tax=Euplotes crassus TaxID=5936 RepID=A0AAD1UP04_EUPCR|nr:unnamed protein product [Moneuplotes crassus]